MTERWKPGTTIVQQEVWDGKLWSARPMTVVEDEAERLILWCPRGMRWKTATTPPTRERAPTRSERFVRCFTFRDWVLGDFAWGISNLLLLAPGARHAVWVGWEENWSPYGWYVNFQRPYQRTSYGIQTMDLMLDIVVDQDRTWRWKDEDEFEALVTPGFISEAEARCVRADARDMVLDIEANRPPFNQPWHDWRPDPLWPVPELPPGWDLL